MPVASVYENGGIIGQTLDFGSTEQYISGSTTPSYVGGASTNGSTTLSLTGITGLQEGDLVIVFVTEDSASWSPNSTGWTYVTGTVTNSIVEVIAYKVMGSTVDTSFQANRVLDAFTATAWRGVDYESISSVVTATSNTINPTSVTVTNDNSVVLVLAAIDDDNSTISSPPTGYTTAVQNGRGGGSNAQIYKTGVSAGTEDPSSLAWASPDSLIAYTLVLSPQVTYGNKKNSGIWNLNAVHALLSIPSYDYESAYGTPDYTVTTFPSYDLGVTGSYDVIVAVDANIASTDDGILFELGGAAGAGMAAGVNNGTLRARAFDSSTDSAFSSGAGQAHVEVDISSYTGADATYYFVVDQSTYTLTVYVQEDGAGSSKQIVQLGTDTADGSTTDVYGNNAKGYGGTESGMADLGAAYEVTFNGTIDEIRIWTEDATLDVSGFGATSSTAESTINFVQYYQNLSSDILTATQSLTNCSFGPSISGNKRVVVAVGTNQGGGAATFVGISSATINGTSATIIQNTSSTAGQEHASIIYADISGSVTSGTISITYNSTLTSSLGSQGTICGVYYIDNPENIVSVTSAFSHRNNSLGAHSATVSTSQGLVVASGAIGGSSSTSSLTWSGATEDYEYDPQPTRDDVFGGASIESSGTSVTVSTTPNTEYGVLAVASFNLST